MKRFTYLLGLALLAVACSTESAAPTSTLRSTTTVPSITTTTEPSVTTTTEPSITTTFVVVESPLFGRTIVVDPGHNGMNWAHPEEIGRLVDIGNGEKACNTTGTMTTDGYTEAEFNWAVATLLAAILDSEGANVVLTRPDNEGWGPCIDQRAATGNSIGADLVISIHADGGPAEGRGFHVIHPANTPGLTDDIYEESLRLAREVHRAYLATSMTVADYIGVDGFSERDDLGGLNLSDVPVVFLEAGNMRNETDANLLTDAAFQEAIARAIADAITAYFTDGG